MTSANLIVMWFVVGYMAGLKNFDQLQADDRKLYGQKLQKCMSRFSHYPREATKIFDFLYLGGEDDAVNLKFLRELGITHVINCASR